MAVRRSTTAPRILRSIGAASAVYGAGLLIAPARVVSAVGGARTPPPDLVVRVLGARQIGQGGMLMLRPARSTAALSAGVDAVHALTMAAAAVRWPQFRRVAAVSGAVAIASGVLALVAAR